MAKKKSEPPSPVTLGLYSLGCTKNLVDSEVLLGDLLTTGQFALSHPEEAEILIINTCGFLEASKEESLDTIRQAAELKEEGKCRAIMVIGCLAERYREKIREWAPEVDYVVPLSEYQLIPGLLQKVAKKGRKKKDFEIEIRTKQVVFPEVARFRLTPRHYGYLRISEGCNHKCTFCVIPKIRGLHRSKPINFLVDEARELVRDGAVELNLIADDSTFYGIDLDGKPQLPALLRALNDIEGLHWIRLFYAYPTTITHEMIESIRDLEKVVPYIDMPIQHISDPVLKNMKRGKSEGIRELIGKFRELIPGVILRTTVIVGFPGEEEKHFQELVDFVKETQFQHLGIFMYSPEKGSPSAEYKGQVSEEEKIRRYDLLAEVQTSIVHSLNQKRIGKEELVLVDGQDDGLFYGRTAGDGPEIDNLVWIEDPEESLEVGTFVTVKIQGAQNFDLSGKVKKIKIQRKIIHGGPKAGTSSTEF